MKPEGPARAPRGRPPSITRERIANAGIAVGLPDLTFVGVAEALGVSHMALYKHVPSLEALKQLVAEEIFTRWDFPPLSENRELADYLADFVASLRALVKVHPGLPALLIRESAATQRILDKIDAHHRAVARAYGLPKKQATWLLSTVAFHCIAVADMIYRNSANVGSLQTANAKSLTTTSEPTAAEAKRTRDAATMEREFSKGMHALIIGTLALLEKPEPVPRKKKE